MKLIKSEESTLTSWEWENHVILKVTQCLKGWLDLMLRSIFFRVVLYSYHEPLLPRFVL